MKTLSLDQMEIVKGGRNEQSGAETGERDCVWEHIKCWGAAIGWAAVFGTGAGAIAGGIAFGLVYGDYLNCLWGDEEAA
ncbi:MAG: hypothetical protein LBU22_09365 [Dysgonamonadaceae bacterium]|jgi:hypothetical protein|nr:hypothetical protein [Dysgonamonadaceae bacterium]